ncbi:MAG TPA: hypothetical protein VMV23_01045 [Candidatus Nanopelagicaceae bacterium]|nr:hypothetical protein [Candidatus Nanopelagicaceae bacterium]
MEDPAQKVHPAGREALGQLAVEHLLDVLGREPAQPNPAPLWDQVVADDPGVLTKVEGRTVGRAVVSNQLLRKSPTVWRSGRGEDSRPRS